MLILTGWQPSNQADYLTKRRLHNELVASFLLNQEDALHL